MMYLLWFILIIILGGYVLLYWSVKKDLISFKGAGLITLTSLVVYLLFPFLLKKIEIQSTTLLLFLFVLGGIAMVLLIEEKKDNTLVGNDNITENKKAENNIRNENNMDNLLNDEEDISYVDFEKKSSKYEKMFLPRRMKEIKPVNDPKEQEQRDSNVSLSTEDLETNDIVAAVTEETDKKALTIEQCIDKAFVLKESGRFLEAIEYNIEVLDRKPDDQLMLWVVVDICSLYKQLGNDEMAREMMQSYIESFGENMDEKTKEELLKNI